MRTQIIKEICSQYKAISESVLLIKSVRFLGKEITLILLKLGFIIFAEHRLCTQSISDCRRKQSLDELIAR
jgi:hypothetical protein